MKKDSKKLAVIIQCRLSSSRLPGKAVKLLGGKSVLEWTLRSMKKVSADFYYVATDEESYDELKPVCESNGFEIFKGPLEDVMERYCLLIEKLGCDTVLRATADNPFLFYEAAELLCKEFEKQNNISTCDYMTWTGLPHGSGVEIFSAASLLRARKLTKDPYDREHVGPGLYNHKNLFTSLFFKAPSRFYFPEYRTTIDTPADFRRAISVVNKLSGGVCPEEPYTTEQIVSAVKDPSVHDTILFIPSCKKGQGTGHLRRCLSVARDSGSFVYIPENPELEETDSILQEYIANGIKDYQIVRRFPENNEYALVVTDLFQTDKEVFEKLSAVSNVCAIDEGSSLTSYADYLLDIIPSYNLKRKSNLSLPDFIEKPVNRKKNWSTNIKEVLVTLGGEDPANLTVPASVCFAKSGFNVTAILQENHRPEQKISGVTFVDPVINLKEELFKYDLVVTHYGLTAFEAVSAGCSVILLSTTRLHENLAKKYGFVCLSKKDLQKPLSVDLFKNNLELFPQIINPESTLKLSDYVKDLAHGKRYACPVCRNEKKSPDEIVARTDKRTFRRCSECGMVYISWTINGDGKKYEKSYFAEEYKKQYGKTYLDDFESIKKTSMRRMLEINAAVKGVSGVKPTVLDIGCAYGPFISAANDDGWQPYGTDISKDAIDYVSANLLFPAVESVFPDFDAAKEFGVNQFDAVTMWYVIEHFADLKTVLEKVSGLVKKGGVFAFSTPSCEGVSAKYNRESFFEHSPEDHYTLWEPSRCDKVLKKFGFKVLKIVSTGHHPERFPKVKNKGWKSNDFMFNVYDKISKAKKLGDTFEVYCRKI